MSEVRAVTGAAMVVALACIAGSVAPAVDAWLSWAMRWVLGIGVGGPLLIWAAREVWAEVGLAREIHRARPRVEHMEVRSE